MNWVIWDIYEWYLLFHGGAVLRGGRKPMVELPNVPVQTAKQHLVISFIYVRVYYWTAVEWKELLPGSSLSHLD